MSRKVDGPPEDDMHAPISERASREEHEREVERIRALLSHIQTQTKTIKTAVKEKHVDGISTRVEGLLERTEALLEEVEELYEAEVPEGSRG